MECTVHTVSDAAPRAVSLPAGSCAEDAVLAACRSLNVAPITRPLYALRDRNSLLFLPDAGPVKPLVDYELRIRFKVSNLHHLRSLDANTYDYYFRQARNDVVDNCVPEIQYAQHKKELLGLGIADMYRAIQEDNKTLREVERHYKKYIPKEIIRKHQFFTKKPIHNTLEQWCQKTTQNPTIIKAQYLEQLCRLAPNYLSEVYSVHYMPFGGHGNVQHVPARLHLMPFHEAQPGLRLFDEVKRKWVHLCTMEQLIFLGRKALDTEVEVCRKNGVQVYLRFTSAEETSSFISGCGGYYRLMVKWTFNLSKDDLTPSLERLYSMKCHGPVGGEFSYHKLNEKGSKRHGCFILRQCQHDYHVYYMDVCTENNTVETYKVEFKGHCYTFNGDESKTYSSIEHLVKSFGDPQGRIYLKECLPASEYDKSQLLLCGEQYKVGVRIDQAELQELLKHHKSPRCINTRDILIFKGPWCYNEDADSDNTYTKRYCDVALCDDRDCELLTRHTALYSHYVTIAPWRSSIEFSVRLWDADEGAGAAVIVLSVVDVPASEKDIERWGSGIRLLISNNGTGITIGSKEVILEETPRILKATEYTNFTLSWQNNMLVLGRKDATKPLYMTELDELGSLVSFFNSSFRYLSVTGTNLLWDFPFCDDDFICEEHTTFLKNFTASWPLRQNNLIYDLQFYVRSFHSIMVSLTSNPYYDYPRVLISIGLPDNMTKVEYQIDEKSTTVLSVHILNDLVSYFEYAEFHVTMFARELQLLRKAETGIETVLKARHEAMSGLRWFSIGSDYSWSHWTLYCAPLGVPPAFPPECTLYDGDVSYAGTQAVTNSGPNGGLHFSLKEWDPDFLDGIMFKSFSSDVTKSYTLYIGADNNEKVILSFKDDTADIDKILVQKSLPHLIPAGKWGKFWIQFPKGQIKLGFQNRDDPIFEWESTNDYEVFNPAFVSYQSLEGNVIGVHFKDEQCHTENTSTLQHTRIFSVRMWRPSLIKDYSNFSIYLRGNGVALIPLLVFPGWQVLGAEGITATYKAIWKLDDKKKMEVALKTLVKEKTDSHLKDFIELANKWAGVQSSSVVRLYGVTLMSPSALVMEYLQYGPLNVFLSENSDGVKPLHLTMAAAGLARALLDLSEANCVHGRIRCSKVLLAHHDSHKLTVKLSDPGLHSYTNDDIHWIPVEFFSDMSLARRYTTADVWAFGTTLWEIFSYGLSPNETNPVLRQKTYEQGHRLSCPAECPREVWTAILSCWSADPHRRAIPQVVMRDISHVLHRETISAANPYATIIDVSESDMGVYEGTGAETVSSDHMFNKHDDNTSNTSRATADSDLSFPSTSVITTPEHNASVDSQMPFDTPDCYGVSEPDIHSMQWILGMGPKSSIQLLNPIGSGNYGEVYKGFLEREGVSQLQTVAVKRLKSHGDQGTLNDFRKEIDIMKTLQHPNIVEILGVCEEREMLIVMDYLEHGALSLYLRMYRDKVQHSDLIKYASDVASGMEYLSSKHVVHRDLAARNILVKHHRHVQISDFGLARFTTDNDVYRMKTMRDLPLNWYSPEATQGEFSTASDVWSYGVTLWEMFTFCRVEVPKLDLTALKTRAECFAIPTDCPQEVYRRLMQPCWNYRPELRPKFIQLVHVCKQFQMAY